MYQLRPYQQQAVGESLALIAAARSQHRDAAAQSAIILSAPTGAGKTVMASAVMDALTSALENGDAAPFTILWLTDSPSLNRQSANRIRDARTTDFPIYVISGSGTFRDATGEEVAFDKPVFDEGSVYFLNTQAASDTAGLSRKVKGRKNTIWETISNTVEQLGSRFIVMIDEAHRGAERDEGDTTVIGRVISSVPVVYGISATDQRFRHWMHQEGRAVKTVEVSISAVKESGVIKSNLIVSDTVDGKDAQMTLLRDAVRQTLAFDESWKTYCADNNLQRVYPLMIVQVQNSGADPESQDVFSYETAEMVQTVLDEWKGLTGRGIVHTFTERKDLTITDVYGNQNTVSYMEPDLIDGDDTIRVVFAKTAIATGWDCPRAEVLVSFRRATDETYITQLIGRMIRQPMSKRIADDESLNSAYCTLPNFNAEAVKKITKRLQDEGVAPNVVNVAPITYQRSSYASNALFDLLRQVPSYRVPNGAFVSSVARLRRLAAALSRDGIDAGAPECVKEMICRELDGIEWNHARRFKAAMQAVAAEEAAVRQVAPRSIVVERSSIDMDDESDVVLAGVEVLSIDDGDHERRFLTDSLLPKDIRTIYRSHLCTSLGLTQKEANRRIKAFNFKKLQTAEILHQVSLAMIEEWKSRHETSIAPLMFQEDGKYNIYQEVYGGHSEPTRKSFVVPKVIQENIDLDLLKQGRKALLTDDLTLVRKWALTEPKHQWNKHLYTSADMDGKYLANVNGIRRTALSNEIEAVSCIGWYNNPPNTQRSIAVPFTDAEDRWSVIHPSYILFHEAEGGGVETSILDVRTEMSSDELLPRLRGWVIYAGSHHKDFADIKVVIRSKNGDAALHLNLADAHALRALTNELLRENCNVESVFLDYGGRY